MESKIERKAFRRMIQAVKLFRELRDDMPSQAISTFLVVAASPSGSIQMSDLSDRLDMTQSSTSRNVALLSAIDRRKNPGFGLLKWELDPVDFRKKVVSLTPKGQRLAARLAELWKEEED